MCPRSEYHKAIVTKFWQHIEEALDKKTCPIYFFGSTLGVDYKPGSGIALDIDGTGFVFGGNDTFRKNPKVFIPLHVLNKVRKIYFEAKRNPTYNYARHNVHYNRRSIQSAEKLSQSQSS